MKIAMVTETFFPSTNGVVTRLTHCIRWLTRQGHEVIVIAPDQGVGAFAGAQIYGIPSFRFFLYPNLPLSLPGRKVGKLLRAFSPDVVHVVNPAMLGAAGVWFGRRYPLVASYHTHVPQYADFYKLPWLKPALWGYLRLLHNRADLNLCTSEAVRGELEARRFRNVRLWKRGVDPELFGPHRRSETMRLRLSGGEPEKRLLLYVGRLTASSGFRLAVVGDGPHRPELEAYFAGTGTVFTGFLHGTELAEAYASSDVFAFPSATETLGLVLLEAMASGLPVIAAASAPTREQVAEGTTGFLYEPGAADGLVRAAQPLQDGERLRRMGAAARAEASQLGWDEPSRQLLELYRQAILERELRRAGTLKRKRINEAANKTNNQ